MKDIKKDSSLVAFCGLYCGSCPAWLKNKCPGCRENVKATWCKIRTCCADNKYMTCADCKSYKDVNECRLFNNFISKVFAFVFRSNRKACITQIREKGIDRHAEIMAMAKSHSLRR